MTQAIATTPALPAQSSRKKIEILMIEDAPADTDMIRGLLALSGSLPYNLCHVASLHNGLKRLARGKIDVVLLDLNLPDSSGISTAQTVRGEAPEVPVIILTSADEKDLAVQAVHEGAQDYLLKASVDSRLLERSIRYAVERQRLTAEVNRKYQKEQELSRFKTELVSTVSHEFANALCAIECALPLIMDNAGAPLSEQAKHFYEIVRRNVDVLDAMAHNLVHMGRLEDGRFSLNLRRTELAPLLEKGAQCLELLAKRKGIRVILDLPSRPAAVKADPEMLYLVVSNLLSNAIKYTPKNGKVTVGASLEALRPDRVEVFVSDTGIGIPRQEQEKIFTAFYRTQIGIKTASGFGVGLAFAKAIVEAHGSAVKVVSAPGKGSRFSFSLPRMD